VPWLRRLVAGFSPWRPGFDPWSVHVGFVVDKVALGQVFLRVAGFPCQFHSSGAPLLGKLGKKTAHHLHHRVAQKALRLWCVRCICCVALHHVKKTVQDAYTSDRAVLRRGYSAVCLLGLWVRIPPGAWMSAFC
jgi:hypothetical protein